MARSERSQEKMPFYRIFGRLRTKGLMKKKKIVRTISFFYDIHKWELFWKLQMKMYKKLLAVDKLSLLYQIFAAQGRSEFLYKKVLDSTDIGCVPAILLSLMLFLCQTFNIKSKWWELPIRHKIWKPNLKSHFGNFNLGQRIYGSSDQQTKTRRC